MNRVLDPSTVRSVRRPRFGRVALEASAFVAAITMLAACGSSSGYKVASDYDVAAEIQSESGDPVAGVDVQVWIADLDRPASQRTPLAMNPVITTNDRGLAVWTFQSVAEPQIVGYEVKSATGEMLAAVSPDLRNDLSVTPSRVIIRLDP